MPTHNGDNPAHPWPFDQAPDVVCFTLRRIVLPEPGTQPHPILLVSHDEDDHAWQFLDGEPCSPKDAALVCMKNMLNHDPTLADIADLPPGWEATRAGPGAPWIRKPRAD